MNAQDKQGDLKGLVLAFAAEVEESPASNCAMCAKVLRSIANDSTASLTNLANRVFGLDTSNASGEAEEKMSNEHEHDDDLRALAEQLEEAEDLSNKMDYMDVAKMPCPECGGSGQLDAGSLGGQCPGCFGARFVDQPFSEPRNSFKPQLAALRHNFTAYCHALDAHRVDPELPAPDAELLPTTSEIAAVVASMAKTAMNRPLTFDQPQAPEQLYSGAVDVGDRDIKPDKLCPQCGARVEYPVDPACSSCGFILL